ncbi:MAG: VCBS repeat-containing protein, partial [Planctomycetota bacterium]|nr:VCBS repeat-containing protein [Planctomycetota bacterium]
MNEHPVDPTQQDSDADPVERSTVDESLDYDLDTLEQDDTVIGTALRKSLAVFGIVAILVTATVLLQGYLAEDDVEVTERAPLEVPQVPKRPGVEIPQVIFSDITAEAGIDFVHENGAYGDKLLPETMGGGCAFLDFDNDGDQDLLLVNSRRWDWDTRPQPDQPARMALLANDGKGHFTDVTEQWGLAISLYGMGAAVGDFDNDGHTDLFISAVGHNRLFRNTGKTFQDVTGKAGVAGQETAWSSSCGFFDADADGDLDLFVCNYVGWNKDNDLAQNFTLDGKLRAYGQPQKFPGSAPYLYLNNGDGTFVDVTAGSGIEVRNAGTNVPLAKSLGVAFADLNGDGHVDLVVANDTVRNFLYLGKGDGTFEEEGRSSGIAFDTNGNARGAMGIDIGRFRNSDELGIAIGNFANETTALYVRRTLANQLPVFQDEAISNGIAPPTRPELTFGVFFFDSDLDGRLDIFA